MGQPYVGATLSMYPPPGESNMGNFIAWDGKTGKIVWSALGGFRQAGRKTDTGPAASTF